MREVWCFTSTMVCEMQFTSTAQNAIVSDLCSCTFLEAQKEVFHVSGAPVDGFRESQCGVCERSLHICSICAPSALSTSDQQVQMDLCRLCVVKSATYRSHFVFG